MIYIYHDFGGTHTTSLAAAYHLGILHPAQIPTKEEILGLPYFNKLQKSDKGKIIFRGMDEDGNPVYTIGKGSSKYILPALNHLSLLFHDRFQLGEKIIFSNTSPTVPLVMSLGGFFSRGLGIDFIGVPLLVKGAQKCSKHIYQLVEETKDHAKKTRNQNVLIIENKQFQA